MNKNSLRLAMRRIRRALSPARRQIAAEEARSVALKMAARHSFVLSYASFQDELCTLAINHQLASHNKLVLPRVHGQSLEIFHVTDPTTQLLNNKWGIPEPDPSQCQAISPQELGLLFVPGLGFDIRGQRIGYGKGFYDRFLQMLPKTIPAFGLGFKEQLSEFFLPVEEQDIPLSSLLLF